MTADELLHVLVADALAGDARRARVFLNRHMACPGCAMARFETIAEAAAAYGIDARALASAIASATSE